MGDGAPRDESATPVRVGLVGGGKGGAALLDLLLGWPAATVTVVVDPRAEAPALVRARELGLATAARHHEVFAHPVDLVLEATGDPGVLRDLLAAKPAGVEVVGAGSLRFFWTLLQEKARTSREAEMLAGRLGVLYEVSRRLAAVHDTDQILALIVDEAARLVGAEAAALRLREGDDLVLRARTESAIPFTTRERIKVGESLSGRAVASGEPVVVDDVVEDARYDAAQRQGARASGFHGFVAVPLRSREETIGALNVYTKERQRFAADTVALLTALADQAAIAIERARLFEELRRSYEEIQRAQQRLVETERLRALGELAGGVAHNFNNLLAVILGRADLLLKRTGDGNLRRGLEAIHQAARDGAQMVRRVQEYTGTRATRELEAVDVREVLGNVIELARPHWEGLGARSGTAWTIRLEGDPVPAVRGIPEDLREIFTCLLLNGLEAMPAGGRFVFRTRREAEEVVVRAEDSGTGMAADVRARVFEPFFTTKGPQHAGLGLSSVAGIVARHGGRIDLECPPEGGSVFTLRLPAAPSAAPARPAPPVAAPPRPARILLVEDSLVVRAVLGEILADAGYEVLEADDGPAALARCAAERVDLVVSDVLMPGLSGWDVAAACQARFPGLPVGFITGWGDQLDTIRLGRHGVRFVLAKPFVADDVLREVARALAEHPAAQVGR